MTSTTKTPATPTPAAPKARTKQPAKQARPAPSVERQLGRAAGLVVAEIVKTGRAAALAKRLAAGQTLSHAQLVSLRDWIKLIAKKLREVKKNGPAAKLSRANRAIRRLERASRRGR